MLQKGELAPSFTLDDADGKPVSLSDFLGRKVVVYFYPKDDTPGCTTEACGFRDAYDDFLQAGAAVVGISPDTSQSHGRFRSKYNLPFALLSDPDHKVAEAYGAWGEKTSYGKTTVGILRSTYVLDETGTVLAAFPRVSPDGHANAVLAVLRG